jgi:hypothetical protein
VEVIGSNAMVPFTYYASVPRENAWSFPCKFTSSTPRVNKEFLLVEVHPSLITRIISPYNHSFSKEVWPSLLQVEEMDSTDSSPPNCSPR